MLLALDIGNTNITFGIFQNNTLIDTWRISTDHSRTSDEYAAQIMQILHFKNIDVSGITKTCICSVVPPLTPTFVEICESYLGSVPVVVSSGSKTGIKVNYDSPRDVGADRVVDASAAYHIYGAPFIIVDLGTATVFDAVNEKGEYLGGAIAPGMVVSADSLFRATSQLRRVELNAPPNAIGKNTVHSIQSGLVLGYSELIKGMITRFKEELSPNAKIIATGGQASIIEKEVGIFDVIDTNLTLKGLQIIYKLNSSGNSGKE